MSRFKLTEQAQNDLVRIRAYYLQEAGSAVTRAMLSAFLAAFRFLARNPRAGHRREDLAELRPILFWPVREFLVLYKPLSTPLEIIAIVRASRDIPTLLEGRPPSA